MFSATVISLGLAALAAAQQVHQVSVGGPDGALTFSPEAIAAQPGDQVVFSFHPKNHTITQSSFASPCGPMDGGIDSGFMPVAANVTDNFPTYTIKVNDTKPIWVYCKQASGTPASHCGKGMVFAVNCGLDGAPNSFTNFKNSALAIGAALASSAPSSGAPAATGAATATYTAAYGGVTIAPPPSVQTVTEGITLASSTWTTTYASYANSPAPTPGAVTGNVINVMVGGPGKLLFDPAHVTAQPRDTIVFTFAQKNHTVTQSTFADPCRKATINGAPGFDSGFFPVADGASPLPTWNLTVNDTAPIWAYCRQATHCGQGMVFAVNSDETSGRNFSAYQSLAKQLNGSAAAVGGAPAASSPYGSGNGAAGLRTGGAAVAVVVAGALAALL